MYQLTRDFLESLTKEEIIEYVDNLIEKRNEKENSEHEQYLALRQENQVLKNKLDSIKRIAVGKINIPATLNTALAERAFGKE